MKFLFYIDSLASGGAERQLYELSKGLVEENHEVGIIINYPDYHYLEEDRSDIKVWCTNTTNKNLLKRSLNIIGVISKFKPDVVISFKATRNLEMMLLSSLFKSVKVKIASIRNDSNEEMRFYQIYSKFSTLILSNSEAAKKSIEKKYGQSKKLGVIKNVINLEKFDINKRVEGNKKVGLCLARLTTQKNQLELIEAVRQLSVDVNLEIRLVGHHEDKEYTEQVNLLVKKHSLENKIKILGERKDIVALLNESDFVILASKYEGFPNTVMESMASRRFVLATDVGGTGELIKDMETGILISQPRAKEICKSLEKYLSLNEMEKNEIVNNGFKLIRNYTPENVINELLSKIIK